MALRATATTTRIQQALTLTLTLRRTVPTSHWLALLVAALWNHSLGYVVSSTGVCLTRRAISSGRLAASWSLHVMGQGTAVYSRLDGLVLVQEPRLHKKKKRKRRTLFLKVSMRNNSEL